jgi:hypothetical protein
MKYTYRQRCEILQRARDTLARLRMQEAIDGLAEEKNWATPEEGERLFREIERRERGRAGLIYKVKMNARIR